MGDLRWEEVKLGALSVMVFCAALVGFGLIVVALCLLVAPPKGPWLLMRFFVPAWVGAIGWIITRFMLKMLIGMWEAFCLLKGEGSPARRLACSRSALKDATRF